MLLNKLHTNDCEKKVLANYDPLVVNLYSPRANNSFTWNESYKIMSKNDSMKSVRSIWVWSRKTGQLQLISESGTVI